MDKVATEKFASDLAGLNRTYTSNLACTRTRAIALGCYVNYDCSDNLLVCEEWLEKRSPSSTPSNISNVTNLGNGVKGKNYTVSDHYIFIDSKGGNCTVYCDVQYTTSSSITYNNGETETSGTKTIIERINSDTYTASNLGTTLNTNYSNPANGLYGYYRTTLSASKMIGTQQISSGTGYVVFQKINTYKLKSFERNIINNDSYVITVDGISNRDTNITTNNSNYILEFSSGATSNVRISDYYTINTTYSWTSDDVTITNATSQNCKFTVSENNRYTTQPYVILKRTVTMIFTPTGTYSSLGEAVTKKFVDEIKYDREIIKVVAIDVNWNSNDTPNGSRVYLDGVKSIPCNQKGTDFVTTIIYDNYTQPTLIGLYLSNGQYVSSNFTKYGRFENINLSDSYDISGNITHWTSSGFAYNKLYYPNDYNSDIRTTTISFNFSATAIFTVLDKYGGDQISNSHYESEYILHGGVSYYTFLLNYNNSNSELRYVFGRSGGSLENLSVISTTVTKKLGGGMLGNYRYSDIISSELFSNPKCYEIENGTYKWYYFTDGDSTPFKIFITDSSGNKLYSTLFHIQFPKSTDTKNCLFIDQKDSGMILSQYELQTNSIPYEIPILTSTNIYNISNVITQNLLNELMRQSPTYVNNCGWDYNNVINLTLHLKYISNINDYEITYSDISNETSLRIFIIQISDHGSEYYIYDYRSIDITLNSRTLSNNIYLIANYNRHYVVRSI